MLSIETYLRGLMMGRMRVVLSLCFFLSIVISCRTPSENLRGKKRAAPPPQNQEIEDPIAPAAPGLAPGSSAAPVKPGTGSGTSTMPIFEVDEKFAQKPYLPPTANALPDPGNPFLNGLMFVNPIFTQQVDYSAAKAAEYASQMKTIRSLPTAVWLDNIDRIKILEPILKLAEKQTIEAGKPVILTLIIYNLPNRDCFANASNGLLPKSESGLAMYKSQYIDPIAKALIAHPKVKVVTIIEPDSLPNLITNKDLRRCTDPTDRLYTEGVAYAVRRMNEAKAAIYVDLAHSGWLGWVVANPENAEKRAVLVKKLEEIENLSGAKLRGFAINVANYTPLRRPADDNHPEEYYKFNRAQDELTFAQKIVESTEFQKSTLALNFVVDTSRNGNPYARLYDWGNWCNVKEAGLGELPMVAPAPRIDAYLWLKTPGESDGVSDRLAPRYDESCVSPDSLANAPQAGEWFHDQFVMLVKNANKKSR